MNRWWHGLSSQIAVRILISTKFVNKKNVWFAYLLKGIEVRELLELRWFRCKLAFELFSKLLMPSYIVSLMALEMASSAHFMTKSPDPDSELPPIHNLNSLRLAWGILQPRMLLIKKQMGLSEPTAKNFTSTEVSTIRWGPDIWKSNVKIWIFAPKVNKIMDLNLRTRKRMNTNFRAKTFRCLNCRIKIIIQTIWIFALSR